jgi:hypothetical protein
MVRSFAISASFVISILAASAETATQPDEAVRAPAATPAETLDQFAKSFATPTRLTGKIARWDSGICPVTVGQPPLYASFVTKRVKEVATAVGAPVDANASCKPNIEIVFTTTPQELLDNVRQHQTDLLGYAESSSQKDRLAMVTHPIQAWYMTETKDLHGRSTIDGARRSVGGGTTLSCFTCSRCPYCMGVNAPLLDLPEVNSAVTGSTIKDGVRSIFFHAIIVVDSNRMAGHRIGPLADYIAMLALTQLNSLDTCQQLSSIVNMMAADCDQKVDGITATDLAYLRGLYKMDADKSLLFQQSEIANVMEDTMGR